MAKDAYQRDECDQFDFSLPVGQIAPMLVELVNRGGRGAAAGTSEEFTGKSAGTAIRRHGDLTGISRPDCGGPLWERAMGEHLVFRCPIGHRYSAEPPGRAAFATSSAPCGRPCGRFVNAQRCSGDSRAGRERSPRTVSTRRPISNEGIRGS